MTCDLCNDTGSITEPLLATECASATIEFGCGCPAGKAWNAQRIKGYQYPIGEPDDRPETIS